MSILRIWQFSRISFVCTCIMYFCDAGSSMSFSGFFFLVQVVLMHALHFERKMLWLKWVYLHNTRARKWSASLSSVPLSSYFTGIRLRMCLLSIRIFRIWLRIYFFKYFSVLFFANLYQATHFDLKINYLSTYAIY